MSRGSSGAFRRAATVVLVLLGFLPALLLSNVLLASISATNLSCARVEFGAPGSQYRGCSVIAGELIVVVALAWAVPLVVLAALLYLRGRGEGAGVVPDRTDLFVRATAVVVGLANALVIGDPLGVVGAPAERQSATFAGFLILAALAGLAASEIALRRGRSALGGGFLARYGVAVLGLCLGGAILGGSSWVVTSLLNYAPGPPGGPESGLLFFAYATFAYGSIAALGGGVLGLLEGLILGLPLSALLGWLRRPSRSSGRSASSPGTA